MCALQVLEAGNSALCDTEETVLENDAGPTGGSALKTEKIDAPAVAKVCKREDGFFCEDFTRVKCIACAEGIDRKDCNCT